MKFVDYKCPNCGGSVKFEKGDSSGYCENCSATLHVETETTDKLFRAFDLISTNRFVAATDLLNEVLNDDVKNGQAYLGLLLCDTECTTPVSLANTKYQFANNPNYIRALDFLSENQRNELVALCNQNQINNSTSNVAPNEAMKELTRLNGIIVANGFTAVQIYFGTDFSTKDENVVIQIYHESKEHMEKMISLYRTLNDEEKKRLVNFNISEFEGAVDTYLQIKEIVSSLPNEACNTEEDGNDNSELRSVEEILADESLDANDKLCELSLFKFSDGEEFDCVELLLDEADNVNWLIGSEIPEDEWINLFGELSPDSYFAGLGTTLSDFMANDNERLDAFCELVEKMDEEKQECNINFKIFAHIWTNRPIWGNRPFECFGDKGDDEQAQIRDVRMSCFDMYRYVAKIYLLIVRRSEETGYLPSSAIDNLKRQYQLINTFESQYIHNSMDVAPREFCNNEWGSDGMESVLNAEIKCIKNKINFNYEKAALEYELGGLGLFNASRKKEIKARIAEIEDTIAHNEASVRIAVLENERHVTSLSLYDLDIEKEIVDEAKADFDATPFTAFGRRKELKQKYQSLNEQYLANKTAYENKMKELETKIETIKKNIK